MKKRIVSLLLTCTMVFTMLPAMGYGVGAAEDMAMTEAEAWAAGIDVYMAWYNNHAPNTHVDSYYDDSYFMKLYDDVFPTPEIRDKKLRDAFEMMEKHFNFISDTDTLQYDIYMTLLYSCFYYYDNSESESEAASMMNYTKEQLDTINSVLSQDLIQAAIDAYLDNEWSKLGSGPIIENPPEILSTAETWFGSVEKADKALGDTLDAIGDGFSGVATALQAYLSIKNAADEAAKFVNLDLLNDDFLSIVLHLSNNGSDPQLREAASTLYTMALQNSNKFYKDALVSYTAGKGAYDLSLGLGLEVCSEAFLTLAGSSASAAGGAAASAVVGGIAAEFIGALALGLIIANLMETSIKGLGDLLVGSTRHSQADLDMYFLYIIRSSLKSYYTRCLANFRNNPNENTARKLNAISKLMFNVLLCENDIAGECMRTYETAGLLNIGGEALKNFSKSVSTRRDRLKDRRDEYTENALKAYSEFTTTKVYHITYDTNGGHFTKLEEVGINPANFKQYKIYSLPQTIANTEPTRDGYEFLGWAASATATSPDPNYDPGDTYTANANLTLYAVWRQITAITYNANKGTGAPSAHENTAGLTALSTQKPSRTGFLFLGWSTSADAASAQFQPGEKINLEGNVTLYAVWKAGSFNIIFHTNGGTFPDGSDTYTMQKTYLQSFMMTPPIPTKNGYRFAGYWSLKSDGSTKDYEHGISHSDVGGAGLSDKHLYAVWTDSTYDITYDYNDAAQPLKEYGTADINNPVYTIASPSKNVSSFKGWMYLDPAGTYTWPNIGTYSLMMPGSSISLTGDLYLYAKWDYFIHYNHGTTSSTDIVRNGNNYEILEPKPNGDMEFRGWKVRETGSTLQAGDIIDLDSDLTLSAIWSEGDNIVTYATITYDGNGGSCNIDSTTVESGKKVTLPDEDDMYRKNHNFLGWSESPVSGKVDYKGGKKITVSEDMTLYAVWKATSDTAANVTVTWALNHKYYAPGDTILAEMVVDNSDHFYVNAEDGEFIVQDANGQRINCHSVFVEKSSPSPSLPNNRYTNGQGFYVQFFIPDDCDPGVYEIEVHATDGIYDGDSGNVGEVSRVETVMLITVTEDGEEPTTIDITQSEVTLHKDNTASLKFSVTPTSLKNDVDWRSSNTKVVKITSTTSSRAKIKAVGVGEAKIYASVDDAEDYCVVTVENCSFTKKVTSEEYLASKATCQDYAEYYYSCECDAAGSVTFKYTKGGYADHIFGDWVIVTTPTASSDGKQERKCAVCGEKETEILPATAYDVPFFAIEPSFDTVDSGSAVTCTVYLINGDVPDSAIAFYDYTIELSDGLTYVEDSYTIPEEAAAYFGGISFDPDSSMFSSAYNGTYTGKKLAVLTFDCIADKNAAGEYSLTLIPGLLTDADREEIVGTDPEAAVITVVKGCDHENMTVIPAKTSTCLIQGNNRYYGCSDCNKYFKDSDAVTVTTPEAELLPLRSTHDWSAWTIVAEPTAFKNGLEERVCDDCDQKEKRTIDALGYDAPFLAVDISAETAEPGDTVTVTVSLINTEQLEGNVSAYQFDIVLPDGLTYVADSAVIPSEAAQWFTMSDFNPDEMRCLATNGSYSSSENLILLTFMCTIDEDTAGTLGINLTDAELLINVDGTDILVSSDVSYSSEITVMEYLLGDFDLNGEVDSLDIDLLFRYVIGFLVIEPTAEQVKAGDVYPDGNLDSLDVDKLFRYVIGFIDTLE